MPVSALTQDEIHGMLTLINPEPASTNHRIGIYLTDINAGKAVCIDTGLSPVSHIPVGKDASDR